MSEKSSSFYLANQCTIIDKTSWTHSKKKKRIKKNLRTSDLLWFYDVRKCKFLFKMYSVKQNTGFVYNINWLERDETETERQRQRQNVQCETKYMICLLFSWKRRERDRDSKTETETETARQRQRQRQRQCETEYMIYL